MYIERGENSPSLVMKVYKEFGYVTIDEERINQTIDAYFKWKDLNTYIKTSSKRGLNMPDAISEPMGCYCLGLLWNRGKEVGDATDPETGKRIEFKATSNFDRDVSSFGPDCEFDDLVFLRFNLAEDLLYVYDLGIDIKEFRKTPVSLTETVEDQQKQRRRPRLSLQNRFVDAQNLEPDVIFDIRRCRIKKKK